MSDQGTTSSAANTRRWFIAVLLAMVVMAVAAGMALARSKQAEAGANLGDAPSTSSDPSQSASAPSVVEPSRLAASSAGTPSAGAAKPAAERPKVGWTGKVVKPSTTTSAPSGPVIVHFRVTSKPTCPSGTDQVRYEGEPVVLEWKVTGADTTTLAVDGPGKYGDYGSEGSETLAFPCEGEAGGYQSHTYTLKAVGGDGTKTAKLTVKARIHEITTT